MTPPIQPRPVVLIATATDRTLSAALEGQDCAVAQVGTAAMAQVWARDLHPDVVILDAALPDQSGIEAARALHSDASGDRYVPILVLTRGRATAEQRVTALRAGVWDFLQYPAEAEGLVLKLRTYAQAKRNIDAALAEGLIDPASGLHTRPALARRARELGALMARHHNGLACVVLHLDADPPDLSAGPTVARAARISDVVGALGPREVAVVAPATDQRGAVKLAQRLAGSLGQFTPGATLRAGYEVVPNLTYWPIDPMELLARAGAAVRDGLPEQECLWVRRFPATHAARWAGSWMAGPVQAELEPQDKRRTR